MKKPSLLATLVLVAGTALAQHEASGSVHVMFAWSRALPPVSENGAVYLSLKNYGGAPDRLVGASSPLAARVEIHDHEMEAGLMTMRRVEAVTLNPGEYVKFEPGGRHLMLIGLERPLEEGGQIPLTLVFEKAPTLKVTAAIQPMGAEGPAAAGHEHSHSDEHGHDKMDAGKSP